MRTGAGASRAAEDTMAKSGWPKRFNYAETKMGGSKPIKQKKGK